MDILGQSALILTVMSFGLGVSVVARNFRNKLYLAFGALAGVICTWAFFFFLEQVFGGGQYYQAHLLSHILACPMALILIRVMIRNRDPLGDRLFQASLVLSLILVFGIVFFRLSEVSWIRLVIYLAPLLPLVQVFHLMWIDRNIKAGLNRRHKAPLIGIEIERRFFIYFGGIFVLVTANMDHFPELGRVVPALGNIGLAIYLFFISQAVTQQRLLNFSALLSRFLVLLSVSLILTLVYSMIFAWIQESPGLFFLNSFIVSFLLLVLLDPLRSLVAYFTRSLLTQSHRRLQESLLNSQRALARIVDPEALYLEALQVVSDTLHPEWICLYIQTPDGTRYQRVRTRGASKSPREILGDHLLVQAVLRLKQRGELPILLQSNLQSEMDRTASRSERETLAAVVESLKALSCNLMIPIIDQGNSQILGFLLIHAPAPPESWGANWGLLQVLYPFFDQVGQTLRNMEVFARQREKERLAALGQMAAGLAHEIRNPLGAIKGAAQFLDPSTDRPDSKFLNVIIEEVDRLNNVVSQFLDYSKPSDGHFEKVGLEEIAKKIVDHRKLTLGDRAEIQFMADTSLPKIWASPVQIQQLISNLIDNALSAGLSKQQDKLRIGVKVLRSSGVTLVVEDNGPGIKKEHRDKLFIPFFTTSPQGTGLGLSICRKIADAHQAEIDLESEWGRFTRFLVSFPVLELPPQVTTPVEFRFREMEEDLSLKAFASADRVGQGKADE